MKHRKLGGGVADEELTLFILTGFSSKNKLVRTDIWPESINTAWDSCIPYRSENFKSQHCSCSQLTANAYPRRQEWLFKWLWQTQTKFQAPDFSLVQTCLFWVFAGWPEDESRAYLSDNINFEKNKLFETYPLIYTVFITWESEEREPHSVMIP